MRPQAQAVEETDFPNKKSRPLEPFRRAVRQFIFVKRSENSAADNDWEIRLATGKDADMPMLEGLPSEERAEAEAERKREDVLTLVSILVEKHGQLTTLPELIAARLIQVVANSSGEYRVAFLAGNKEHATLAHIDSAKEKQPAQAARSIAEPVRLHLAGVMRAEMMKAEAALDNAFPRRQGSLLWGTVAGMVSASVACLAGYLYFIPLNIHPNWMATVFAVLVILNMLFVKRSGWLRELMGILMGSLAGLLLMISLLRLS